MKKTPLVLVLLALCLLLCSCRAQNDIPFSSSYTYANSSSYSAGGGRISGKVEQIDINWQDGMVNIAYHKSDEIALSEAADRNLTEDMELHWRLDGKTLYVKYAASGFRSQSGLNKQLTVLLPEGLRLNNAKISVASAEVQADGLNADAIHIQSASGHILLRQSGEAQEIKVDTASGDVALAAENADKLAINTTSGEVNVDGYQVSELTADAVSGDLILQLVRTPDMIRVGTVSGNATIRLPKEAGFTAEVHSTSGTVSGSLPMEHQGKNQYVLGDGHCRISVDTVSGNVQLDEATY